MWLKDIQERFREIIIGVSVIALAVLLGLLLDGLPLRTIIPSLIIILILAIGVGFITSLLVRNEIIDELKEIVSDLRITAKPVFIKPEGLEWLYSYQDKNEIEKSPPGSQVWVLSPNLNSDAPQHIVNPLEEIVKRNIAKSIKYVYFLPGTEEIWGSYTQVQQVFSSRPDLCEIHIIEPERYFSLFPDTHILVFDPSNDTGEVAQVFLQLPIDNKDWWIRTSKPHSNKISGIARKIVQSGEGKVETKEKS